MASRQLGKLKQWAGEKISSRDKTIIVEDELKELEQDIELRKQGIFRLQAASEDYHHVLSKKKETPSSGETEKLMPLDALGIVMVTHGEEYGDDSAYGTCLVAMGRAHCEIATLQEAYGLTFRDTFIAAYERFGQDIKDYEFQRKKLDSRRLSYDAAISKLEKIKAKKEKDKERREGEDELQRCRLRFEETFEDVRSRIQGIQENEVQQLRELTNFLDTELNFAKQYVDILQDVRDNWCDDSTLAQFENVRTNSRAQPPSLMDSEKYPTIRTRRSTLSNNSITPTSSIEEEDEPGTLTPARRKSDAEKPASISRPTSRASRKRSDSVAATVVNDSSSSKANKRMSVTGWASNAVSSITGLGKKDRDMFTALNDDEHKGGTEPSESSRPPSSFSFSRKSPKPRTADLPTDSPKTNGRILKPPSQQEKKLVRALYDFSGSSDELSFKAGDEITVIHEVLDDWWLGLLKDGRKGLFPTTYTEPVSKTSITRRPSPFESEHDGNHPTGGDQNDRHSFDDYMNPPDSANSLSFDIHSITSSVPDDEEERHLMPVKPADADDKWIVSAPRRNYPPIPPPPFLWNRTNTDVPKKTPPPLPPPRRGMTTATPPPIPNRVSSRNRSQTDSSTASFGSPYISRTPPMNGSANLDSSPFDSLVDMLPVCNKFEQHPLERKGLCKNCFRMH